LPTITIYIPKDVFLEIEYYRNILGKSRSAFVKEVLESYLKALKRSGTQDYVDLVFYNFYMEIIQKHENLIKQLKKELEKQKETKK